MLLANFDEITANYRLIVEDVRAEAVDMCRFILERYASGDPAKDRVFQFIFRTAYRIDNAGLTDEYKTRYFELFSEAKRTGKADVAALVRSMHGIVDSQGRQSLQFSFATKLANTVNSTMPLYDEFVAKVFGFSRPYSYLTFDKRLARYMVFYDVLQSLYDKIIARNLLAEPREHFRTIYASAADALSEHKVLDFIFWSAGRQGLYVPLQFASDRTDWGLLKLRRRADAAGK